MIPLDRKRVKSCDLRKASVISTTTLAITIEESNVQGIIESLKCLKEGNYLQSQS
jgi:hypothetical protein